jgi:hypothetical protein
MSSPASARTESQLQGFVVSRRHDDWKTGIRAMPFGDHTMVVDAARLLLFPAMMAFAASTDLFTMKIPNGVPLILVVGFLVSAQPGMQLLGVFRSLSWNNETSPGRPQPIPSKWYTVAFATCSTATWFEFASRAKKEMLCFASLLTWCNHCPSSYLLMVTA